VITKILLTSINILSALDYRNNVYIVLSRLCRSIKGVHVFARGLGHTSARERVLKCYRTEASDLLCYARS